MRPATATVTTPRAGFRSLPTTLPGHILLRSQAAMTSENWMEARTISSQEQDTRAATYHKGVR